MAGGAHAAALIWQAEHTRQQIESGLLGFLARHDILLLPCSGVLRTTAFTPYAVWDP